MHDPTSPPDADRIPSCQSDGGTVQSPVTREMRTRSGGVCRASRLPNIRHVMKKTPVYVFAPWRTRDLRGGILRLWASSVAVTIVTWLILPVVICLSQRLSHACPSISKHTVKLRMAH